MFARKRHYLLPFALGLLPFACTARAQNHELGLTLGRLTGVARNSGPARLDFSGGTAFQANYGYRFLNRRTLALFGEVHMLANPLRDLSSPDRGATRDLATLFVTPGVRVKFASGRAFSPYLAGGAGYALFEQSMRTIDGSPNPAPRNIHRGVVNFGGGADFKVWRFIGGRLEFRDFYSGNPAFNTPVRGGQHNLVAGGGFVLKFGSSE